MQRLGMPDLWVDWGEREYRAHTTLEMKPSTKERSFRRGVQLSFSGNSSTEDHNSDTEVYVGRTISVREAYLVFEAALRISSADPTLKRVARAVLRELRTKD